MKLFGLFYCLLQSQLFAIALSAPSIPAATLVKSFSLTTAPDLLSKSIPELNTSLPVNLTLNVTTDLTLSNLPNPLPDPLPDPYFYTLPGYSLTTSFSDYSRTINNRDVVRAATKAYEDTIHVFPEPGTPIGTDEKFYEAGDAALIIRPNAKMTWEMYKEALVSIMELYHLRLKNECDLGFTDGKLRARVGSGFVRLLGSEMSNNVTTEAKLL